MRRDESRNTNSISALMTQSSVNIQQHQQLCYCTFNIC